MISLLPKFSHPCFIIWSFHPPNKLHSLHATVIASLNFFGSQPKNSHRKSIRDEKQSAKTLIKVDRRAADKFFDEPSSLGLHKFATGAVPQLPHHHGPWSLGRCPPTQAQTCTIYCTFAYKISPNSGPKGSTFNGVSGDGVPADTERVARMDGAVGVTLQHVSLHI